mmetsp:Transcript_25642/g.38328  ORF Transcript_25642/g.38328 Transcript_25642/m.38328 type:complete len:161 (-) Transcript_25642:89-571(-)
MTKPVDEMAHSGRHHHKDDGNRNANAKDDELEDLISSVDGGSRGSGTSSVNARMAHYRGVISILVLFAVAILLFNNATSSTASTSTSSTGSSSSGIVSSRRSDPPNYSNNHNGNNVSITINNIYYFNNGNDNGNHNGNDNGNKTSSSLEGPRARLRQRKI